MIPCKCHHRHDRRRIVLTGGPGGGKTAILELIRQSFCDHVLVLPEAASLVFGGGFPRGRSVDQAKAAQRAIFYVQRELESSADADGPAIVLCDRGTVDGAAYWPETDGLWDSVCTTVEEQLERYDAVIHLRSPTESLGYNHQNALRTESASEALALDVRIASVWSRHPRRFVVEPSTVFLQKAATALETLRRELPECCRHHTVPLIDGPARDAVSAPTPRE